MSEPMGTNLPPLNVEGPDHLAPGTPWWRRVALAVAYVAAMEPARVRAVLSAVLGVLVVVGVSIPADLDGRLSLVVGAVWALIALVQGESTRAKVYPALRVERMLAAHRG